MITTTLNLTSPEDFLVGLGEVVQTLKLKADEFPAVR